MIEAQLGERQMLQNEVKATRSKHAKALLDLRSDTANYRLMKRGEAPKAKNSFDRLEAMRERTQQSRIQEWSKSPITQKPIPNGKPQSLEERLKRLRERQNLPSRDRGPELER